MIYRPELLPEYLIAMPYFVSKFAIEYKNCPNFELIINSPRC